MAIQSKYFQQAFGDFSELFANAESKNVTIHEKAVPLVLSAVAYCAGAVSPDSAESRGEVRDRAVRTWDTMLTEKKGEVIVQADIWKWIRDWFPDPIQGERVPIEIKDWMKDFGVEKFEI